MGVSRLSQVNGFAGQFVRLSFEQSFHQECRMVAASWRATGRIAASPPLKLTAVVFSFCRHKWFFLSDWILTFLADLGGRAPLFESSAWRQLRTSQRNEGVEESRSLPHPCARPADPG